MEYKPPHYYCKVTGAKMFHLRFHKTGFVKGTLWDQDGECKFREKVQEFRDSGLKFPITRCFGLQRTHRRDACDTASSMTIAKVMR
jgi:hypothetical protein